MKSQPKTKTCACGYTGTFFGKKCGKCRTKSFNAKKGKRKPTGELALFKEIWHERGPQSEVSGLHLGDFNICFFSHILSKGAYPEARLDKNNIVIKSKKEHDDWGLKRWTLKDKPEWQWVFELHEQLKDRYGRQQKTHVY